MSSIGVKLMKHVAPNQVKDATDEDFENIFQRAAFFQTLLKNFLEVTRSWSRYVKDAFDSGLCNRKKIRNVRHTNPILSTEMSDSCVFFNIQNLASKSDSKILWKSSFFARKFFSNVSKKFFMSPTRMFKVSRRCVFPSSLRRKKNESHPTHRSKYFWKKLTPPKTGFGGGRLTDSMNL